MSRANEVNAAMDDLPEFVAQFEEDVARIDIFVNGDESQDYTTADGRPVPSLSKIVANVEEMIRPETDAIMEAVQQSAASAQQAQASASTASQAATSADQSEAAALGFMGQAGASAAEAADSRDRAEAASNAAGSARDEAVGAMTSVQQNADNAAGAANRAATSEANAAGSATDAASDRQLAEDAAGDAQTAKEGAEAAREGIDQALADAQASADLAATAQGGAETARDDATAAANRSELAADQAEGVVVGALQSSANLADVANANTARNNLNALSRGGDFMAGTLLMRGYPVQFQNSAGALYGYVGSYGTAGAAGSGIGFVDSALVNWNFQVDNNGNVNIRGTATINGGTNINGRLQLRQPASWGEVALYSANGTVMSLRGRGSEGGGMQWIDNNYSAIVADMDNAGNLRISGTLNASGSVQSGNGSGQLAPNGDTLGSVWGGTWLSQWLATNKANRAALCYHDTGVIEGGSVDTSGGAQYVAPSPFIMVGLGTTFTLIHIYVVYLRNVP